MSDETEQVNETTKAGARHSQRDQQMLQTMHDHAVSLGAVCGEGEGGASGKSSDALVADGSTKNIRYPVKALGGDRLGGYLVMWGNAQQKDLTDEYFTPETEELTAIFKAMGKLPYLYEHATDGTVKTSVVGTIDLVREDSIGLWYEVQMDRASKYKQAIQRLAQQKVLGTSSGTLPGARKVASDGRILRWPIVEGSATVSPAEPRMIERPITEIKSYYAAIGLEFTPETESEGAEDARSEVTAKLRLLTLLEMELDDACLLERQAV